MQLHAVCNQIFRLAFLINLFSSSLLAMNEMAERGDVVEQKSQIKVRSSSIIHSLLDFHPDEQTETKGVRILLVDIDYTLLRPRYYSVPVNFGDTLQKVTREDPAYKRKLVKELGGLLSNRQRHFGEFFTSTVLAENLLMEGGSPEKLLQLSEQGVIILGFTARTSTIASPTYESLRALGIDFRALSKLADVTREFGEGIRLENGIIYTGNQIAKGKLICPVVEVISEHVAIEDSVSVFHIDDSLNEINGHQLNDGDSNALTQDIVVFPLLYYPPKFAENKTETMVEQLQEIYHKFKSRDEVSDLAN